MLFSLSYFYSPVISHLHICVLSIFIRKLLGGLFYSVIQKPDFQAPIRFNCRLWLWRYQGALDARQESRDWCPPHSQMGRAWACSSGTGNNDPSLGETEWCGSLSPWGNLGHLFLHPVTRTVASPAWLRERTRGMAGPHWHEWLFPKKGKEGATTPLWCSGDCAVIVSQRSPCPHLQDVGPTQPYPCGIPVLPSVPSLDMWRAGTIKVSTINISVHVTKCQLQQVGTGLFWWEEGLWGVLRGLRRWNSLKLESAKLVTDEKSLGAQRLLYLRATWAVTGSIFSQVLSACPASSHPQTFTPLHCACSSDSSPG